MNSDITPRLRFTLMFFVCLILFFRASLPLSYAETDVEKFNELQSQIDDLTKKLSETRTRATSLANQIVYMDSQMRLATLKITETTHQITNLEDEIEHLTSRIGVLENSLTDISQLLIDRVVATYKSSQVPVLFSILSSDGFSELISKAKYLALVQSHDKRLLFEVQSTKSDFEHQKQVLEDKKTELDLLQKKLEDQKVQLTQQKADKESLLTVTKNDEQRYQKLLEEAKAEQSAISAVISKAIFQLKDGTPIDEGKEIALMGNSGSPSCSTAAHLHFEVTKDGSRQNPSGYLGGHDVTWDNSPDSPFSFTGSWNWPMNDSIRVTQGYGMTYWARTGFYGGGPHTGIDMVSSNIVIKAPKGGTLYKGSGRCGSSTLKWVAIDHGEGIVSWYFHVQ